MKNINWQKVGLILGIGAGIVFVSAFVTSQLIFPLIFGRPKNIEVPSLVGKNLSAARRELSDLGLHAVVRDSVWSETDKIDIILEQDPEPGELLKPESTVYFRVSLGSKIVNLPSLAGLNYHEAYFTLHGMGLKSAVVDSLYSDSYSVNTVVRSSPAGGAKIEKGSRVRLWLSRGPEPVKEPVAPDSTHTGDTDYLY